MNFKYTNRSLFKVERHFNKPFFQVFGNIENLTLEGLIYLIYVGSESDKTFEEFADEFDISEAKALMPKVMEALNAAFDTGKKKVKQKV